ncbi:UNVERIFIED_CONTAM: hypothetical protein PYX00_000114 [Menopon gallinae]|uniref:Osteoclast-stimulating factor 1 n=1 Tax=Menopon gallinae TaxID=328185 RepID=A0AAW2I902_9NEOP
MNAVGNRNTLPPKPIPKPKPGSVKVVRATYKYTAKYADELSFEEGDILYVFDQSNPEWWKARCKNKSGLIPSNYVENQVEEVKEPLHDAARRGNLTFLQECLSQGVSSTGLDSMGNTPLFWASQANHIDCVKCLLKHSTTAINAQNNFGDTPLHTAAAKNHYQVIEILLQNGANPNIENNCGDIPEKLASDLKVKNLLQKHKLNRNHNINSSFNPEDYEDEDSE